jgi:hypothetical protein
MGIAEKRLEQLGAELDKMPMQSEVRDSVNARFPLWTADTKGKLLVAAARMSINKLGAVYNEKIETATSAGNLAEVKRLAEGRAAAGVGVPEEIPNIVRAAQLKIEHAAEIAQKESILGAVRKDPEGALRIVTDERFPIKESVRAWGINAAKQGIRENLSTLTQQTQDEVAKGLEGNLATPEAVDEWAKTHAGFSPEMVMVTKGHINRINSARHQQYVAQHGPEMASVLDSEISAFDRTDPNAKLDYFQLRTRIDELPGELRAPLYKELDAALSGKPPQMDKTIAAMGRQLTGSMLKEGKFGKYLDPVMVLDANGKATDRQAVNQNGIPQWKINQERWRAAVEQRAKVDVEFQRWLERNPKATPEQAAAAVNTIKPNATRANAWDAMFGPWQQPPTDETYEPAGARRHMVPKAEVVPEGSEIHSPRGSVSEADLRDVLPEPLKAHAKDFIDAADETGLDARTLAAISMFETGDGTAPAFRNKNNAMGISDRRGPTHQPSVRDSIFRQAHTLANPKGPYRKARTIDEIGAIYAPLDAENDPHGTNPEWPEGVKAKLRRLKHS